jgi:transcriptional regulator with XRE-family HTH domain
MTLTEYRENLAWSLPELARKANIDDQTLRKAEQGGRITARIARQIAEALSEGYGRTIRVQDIEGWDVRL